MWRTFRAAFWARPNVPLLGEFPVNAVSLVCVGILGLVNPGFWFLGLGAEAAYLLALGTNARFRRFTEAEERQQRRTTPSPELAGVTAGLGDAARRRYQALEAKCARILDLQRRGEADDILLEGNADSLDRLKGLYAKLLLARQNLDSLGDSGAGALSHTIAALERELAGSDLAPSVRQSKAATVDTLRRRLDSLKRRDQTLQEIDSDLLRVEAQVDLSLDKAAIDGKPLVITANIDLVSNLVESSLGSSYADLPAPLPEPPARLAPRTKEDA